ncbi:hypothetical protein Vretifemale_5125, partial [Volvox reticuliferus]
RAGGASGDSTRGACGTYGGDVCGYNGHSMVGLSSSGAPNMTGPVQLNIQSCPTMGGARGQPGPPTQGQGMQHFQARAATMPHMANSGVYGSHSPIAGVGAGPVPSVPAVAAVPGGQHQDTDDLWPLPVHQWKSEVGRCRGWRGCLA